jgi:hypothetical protein
MEADNPQANQAQMVEAVFSWRHQDFVRYNKNVWWYIISIIVLVLFVWGCIVTRNFLFAIFLVLFYLVTLLFDNRNPEIIDFAITHDGIKTGNTFHYYKEISHFFVIYQEPGIKNLYFEFRNPLKGRLIVPLDGQNAVAIREFLLGFLKEDLEREAEPACAAGCVCNFIAFSLISNHLISVMYP